MAARGIGDGNADGRGSTFAGLAAMLRPLEAELDALAGDGADALRRATAMVTQDVDPTDVAAGLLRALTTAAERAPVLLVLDDADQLDAPTVGALTFLFARLGVDAIGAIAAVRPGPAPFDGITTDVLPLPPLTRSTLAVIAARAVPCTDEVADVVGEWADGSPLLAVELARSLRSDERDGTAPLPDAPRPTVLLVERLQRELQALAADVQRALVVVAADRTGDVATVLAALTALGEDPGVLDRAEASGLVEVEGGRVGFRHTLLRPLAYRLVAAPSRRAAHRALAAALSEPRQAEERAWQLVASCAGPDEDAAAALELVAASERRRGAAGAAAARWEDAARLSVDGAARARRRNAAAAAYLDALDLDNAWRVALDGTDQGDGEAALLLVEAVERRDGPEAALDLAPADGDVRADLLLAAGKLEDARAALSGRLDGGSLTAVLVAALDPGAPLPSRPEGASAVERRARARWLATAAARGTAPSAPSTVDELVAAAVAATVGGRRAEAGLLLARAAALVPAACARLAATIAEQVRAVDDTGPVDALASALSAAELRVAEAVASGLTNREAAASLFLSAKTVDFHLQSIYRKLAIRSRAELATRVATRSRT